jgi:predicted dehydrogenase
MAALKVGLIGCGSIAQLVHLNNLKRMQNLDLTALAEPDHGRREQARCQVPGAIALNDYEDLLALPEVEAVMICSPNALHAAAAIAALERGKHVYLEKPLATNLKEARSILKAWLNSGLIGMIGYNYRFNALYQSVRQQVQSGRLGELVSVRTTFCTKSWSFSAWKRKREDGGGVLLDLALHHIDLVRFIFGQPISGVFAKTWSRKSDDDSAAMQLELANGLLVQSLFSMGTVDEDRFEIYGHEGKLVVDRHCSLKMEISKRHPGTSRLERLRRGLQSFITSPYLWKRIIASSLEPSYAEALAHFVVAVQEKQPASPDFMDGYISLAIVEAAEESARSGRIIPLSNLDYEDSAS